jgi:hypothetical protein
LTLDKLGWSSFGRGMHTERHNCEDD